jgi:hypothetical protein
VNGRLFLNNVSLGIYGAAVQRATFATQSSARSSRRPRRSSVRARSCPLCGSSTTSASPTPTLPSCWCRTTPTRWSARRRRECVRPSTAAFWESWCSTGQPMPGTAPAVHGSRDRPRSRPPNPWL